MDPDKDLGALADETHDKAEKEASQSILRDSLEKAYGRPLPRLNGSNDEQDTQSSHHHR